MREYFLKLNERLSRALFVIAVAGFILSLSQTVAASPFGEGEFGSNSPFGGNTSISISLGSNVNLSLTPSGPNFTASGSSNVTVTSSDVNGYSLYIYSAGSSNLAKGASVIPASSNVTEAALAPNTWGYNLDGSTNYIGMTTTPVAIVNATGPYIAGNTTTVYFGVLTSIITPEGSYTGNVTYTAVAPNV